MKCTRSEMWVYGWHWVKFDTEKEPVKKALLCVRACPDEAVVTATNSDKHVFHWCALHAKDPTSAPRRRKR